MIIGISGKINSGKDTVAQIWQWLDSKSELPYIDWIKENIYNGYDIGGLSMYQDEGSWKIKKFADKLKDIVCILIGCTREQLEDREFKEKELGEEWNKYVVKNLNSGNTISPCFSTKEEAQKWEQSQDWYEVTGGYDSSTILVKMTPRLLLQLLGTDCGRQIIHPNLWVLTLMQDYKGDIEIWKPIENYEDSYEISSFGRVRSLDRKIIYGKDNGQYHTRKGQILKPTLSSGYETVSLSGKTFTVHSLVAKHFVEGYQEGFVVNHIDYNKTNNFYKNLEWITQKDNIKHNKATLRGNFGESQKDAKLDFDKVLAIKRLIEDNTLSQNKIAKLFDVSPTTISDIKKGKKWNHVGKDVVKIEPILPIPVPNWIITDVRFPNEAKAIKNKEGILIRVNRLIGKNVYVIENEQPFQNWYGVVESYNGNNFYNVVNNDNDVVLVHKNQITLLDEHESETALDDYQDWDYVIENDGTVEDLIEKVKEIYGTIDK